MDLVVDNGTVITSQDSFKGSIAIDRGKIVGIGSPSAMPQTERVIDATGLCVLPGIIDGHVHFREPGFEYKEDFHTGSIAAAAGGVTTILDMPNVNPPTQDSASFQLKLNRARQKSLVDFGIYGVVLPTNLNKVQELANEGAIGYKIFMGPTVGNLPSPDDWELVLAFKEIAKTGLRVGVHAENRSMTSHLITELQALGRNDPMAHLESRPSISEAEAMTRAITLTRQFNTKLHIFHLSSALGVMVMREARERGIQVTAETCPHYLLLDGVKSIQELGPLLKMNPPVRGAEDAKALWQGLKGGAVDMIATDHSPHTKEEKFKSNIWEAIAGWPGVETMLPLLLNEVNKGTLTINELVKYASENPARVWNILPRKGSISIGADGDLTIVDMSEEITIKSNNLHSKGKFTPFEGWTVKGVPVHTVVGGRLVMEKGEVDVGAGPGKLVTPNRLAEEQ